MFLEAHPSKSVFFVLEVVMEQEDRSDDPVEIEYASCGRHSVSDECNLCGKCKYCDHCYGCGMCGGGNRDGGYNCGFCD